MAARSQPFFRERHTWAKPSRRINSTRTRMAGVHDMLNVSVHANWIPRTIKLMDISSCKRCICRYCSLMYGGARRRLSHQMDLLWILFMFQSKWANWWHSFAGMMLPKWYCSKLVVTGCPSADARLRWRSRLGRLRASWRCWWGQFHSSWGAWCVCSRGRWRRGPWWSILLVAVGEDRGPNVSEVRLLNLIF